MPRLQPKLTYKRIEALQPDPNTRKEVSDGGSGLYLIVQPSGLKSWSVRCRYAGGHKRVTLGAYPTIPLAMARVEARALLEAVDAGQAPTAPAPLLALPTPAVSQASTVQAAWDLYVVRKLKPGAKPKTVTRFEGVAKRDFLPAWGNRAVASITRKDVIAVLDEAAERGPEARNSAIVVGSAFFNWAASRDLVTVNPVIGQQKTKGKSRDRFLTDDEIVIFWKGCKALGPIFGPMFQMLLLTGARRDEVAGMRYSEISGRKWTIPGERSKTEPVEVYLSDEAMAALATMPRIKGSDFVFTTTGNAPSSGYSKAKKALDKLAPLPHYTLHDLRRSFATGCARIGIPEAITDRCIHEKTKGGSVKAIYNRHDYAPEMQKAWKRWGAHVSRIRGKPK